MTRTALVTGANRGIGLEICRQLAARGFRVLLTSRDVAKGRAAAAGLAQDGLSVDVHPLDVSDAASISHLRDVILRDYGRLDVLVNNAAIYPDEGVRLLDVSPQIVRDTLETNTLGPLLTSQAFIPLMLRHGYGRVVNISSEMGQLEGMGGQTGAYRVSKTALNAVTVVMAAETQGTNVKINCMCPGWVRTDMGGHHADLSVAEGADTAIWLATLPDDGPSGGFFQKRQRIAW